MNAALGAGVVMPGSLVVPTGLGAGESIRVRYLTTLDGDVLRQGLRQLSTRSVQARFFYNKRGFSEAELTRLTHCDGETQCALLAVVVDSTGQERAQLGVARWVRDVEDSSSAEAGIIVCDLWHNRGIGTQLLERLVETARRAGIDRLRAVQLEGNDAARRVFEKAACCLGERQVDSGVVEVMYSIRRPE